MSLDYLISTWGYAAVAAGTFFEGETVLVLGSFAAHRGYLEWPWVIVSGFIGSFTGDQLYFHIGRARGRKAIARIPSWQAKSERVFALLRRNETLAILGFRFLFGLRTVTPFILGASGVSPLRFLLLNMLGAAVWAGTFGSLGYLFGYTMELLLGNLKHYELLLFALIAGAGVLAWLLRTASRVHRGRKGAQDRVSPPPGH